MYYDYAMAAPLMVPDKPVEDMDVLILGMGTGTYATQCRKYFGDMNIEGVEIDEKITELSREYFSLPEDVKVTTYDGRAFLQAVGSAAAVAAQECFAALGSDTGGSIRQPASYCGVVGMKPTYGTVSRYGLIAYGSSLDQIGPLTKDVTDCATVLETITSHDPKDSTSMKREDTDFTSALVADVKGMKIGIPRDYFGEGLDPEVRDAVLAAAEVLKAQGAEVEEFDLSLVDYAIPTYYTIAAAEASSNLERFDGVKYGYRAQDAEDLHTMYKRSRSQGFGPEVKRRIMLGSFVLSSGYYDAYYLKALRVKALIKKAFDEAFAKYDVILGPVAPTTAPKLGSSLADPIKMYLGDIYTISINLAGLPGISVPCGTDSQGLPIGMQLIGDCFKEKTLIRAAYTYEQSVK